MFAVKDLISVGAGQVEKKCVPFVSEYDDCNAENQCLGCTKCTCTAQGTWSCKMEKRCSSLEQQPVDEADIDNALQMMEIDMKKERMKEARASITPLVPQPPRVEDIVLEMNTEKKFSVDEELMDLLRPKRSVQATQDSSNNDTITFHHTVDELNEDTLKDNSTSGTVTAQKVDVENQKDVSRRAGSLTDKTNPLHIEHNEKLYQHIADNKLDNTIEDHYEKQLKRNYTENQKDRHVSKIIVNELKSGTELIGDKNARVTSNVTFTPENDTLTAMAFIAGNLLNKLWNMEHDSTESLETEVIKHEKLSDLLDLFKEPLNLRQETFLKNALEKLSNVIDKKQDIANLTLCDKFDEAKKLLIPQEVNETKATIVNNEMANTVKALDNIKNVLSLISKYEGVNQLINIKTSINTSLDRPLVRSSNLTKDDNSTLNSFGRVLEKITKLLMPSNKKIVYKFKRLNILKDEGEFVKIKKLHPDLANLTLTAKDKIILDYISHIESNPDCLLKNGGKRSKTKLGSTFPSVEGNIMLNLSEFFKMKSLADLIKLLDNDKPNKTNVQRTKSTTEAYTSIGTTQTPKKTLEVSKQKLKTHLKSILEDLVEIQNAKGMPAGKNIKIKDILPCLYKSLNGETEVQVDPMSKVKKVFTNLKRDLKYTTQTRRSNIAGTRPKSAVVWERLIKNLNDDKITRRHLLTNTPKNYEELKKALETITTNTVNTKFASTTEMLPADKNIALKGIKEHLRKLMEIFEDVKVSLAADVIPRDKVNELYNYVNNIAQDINTNGKIVAHINNGSVKRNSVLTDKNLGEYTPYSNIQREENPLSQITRDQIINQLIKNRIQRYLRMKQMKYYDASDDVIYDIAKKILVYIDNGNAGLARELYKIFVTRQDDDDGSRSRIEASMSNSYKPRTQLEPLITFPSPVQEEPKTQEQLIKQLINIKNMKM